MHRHIEHKATIMHTNFSSEQRRPGTCSQVSICVLLWTMMLWRNALWSILAILVSIDTHCFFSETSKKFLVHLILELLIQRALQHGKRTI